MATRYAALLRGINVGGKNRIKMVDLVACFESHGFEDVSTYIQSGNVLLRSVESSSQVLTARVERMLTTTFGYTASVVLRDRKQMRALVDGAPDGFGAEPDRYRYDVVFLMPPLAASSVLDKVVAKEGVDEKHLGRGVLYLSRLIERASQSRLTSLVSMPEYQRMTMRNWSTTTKLLRLMDASS